MNSLKEELDEMLNLFDYFKIPEKKQRDIIMNGVDFNYTWGDIDYNHHNRKFDCLKFTRFLKYCKESGVPFDMDNYLAEKFMYFVHEFDKQDKELFVKDESKGK